MPFSCNPCPAAIAIAALWYHAPSLLSAEGGTSNKTGSRNPNPSTQTTPQKVLFDQREIDPTPATTRLRIQCHPAKANTNTQAPLRKSHRVACVAAWTVRDDSRLL